MNALRNDWPLVPIKTAYAGLFDGPHATPPIATSGPVFLGIGNLTDDGHLDLTHVRHIDEADYLKWTKRVTPLPGDIVFTYEATLNRYAIIPAGFRGCLGRRLALIRPNPKSVDTKFLFYSFFAPEWRQTIDQNTILGATVDRIPLHKFPDFPIRLPPLSVQKEIASVLSAYDDLIENNTRRFAILEEMARRVFEEWFVRFRAPGCDASRTTDSSVGPIPKGWKVARGAELFEVNPDQIATRQAPEIIHYIDITSVIPGIINSIAAMPFSEAPGRARRIVRHGDTIWSCVRPNRRSFALIVDPLEHTIASTGFAVLRPRGLSFAFVYLAATTNRFTAYLTNNATGAAYPAVKAEDFEKAEFVVPPASIVGRFGEIVEPVLLLMNNLHQQNLNLRAQRNLLLPKLISGEIDVSHAEGVMEAAE